MTIALRPSDICRRFGISKSTLFRWESKGYIPAPRRDLRGARCYDEADCEELARFIQSRRHRQRYAEMLAQDTEDVRLRLERLGEENALFKFLNLSDRTGLIELREYSPLQPSTIRQLLRAATNDYDPSHASFWEIIEVVHMTAPRARHND